jgi:hypothetical protein
VLAGTGEEVGDVRIEPDIVAAGAPQAERAVGTLPRQKRIDGVAKTLIGIGAGRDICQCRQVAHVEQRQGAARDLLRTTEWIAVKRGEKPCRVECR